MSKKDQRMVDMYVRNYIDMNDQMVDEYVLMDSSRLGKDLILALGCVVDDPLSVSENCLIIWKTFTCRTNFDRYVLQFMHLESFCYLRTVIWKIWRLKDCQSPVSGRSVCGNEK